MATSDYIKDQQAKESAAKAKVDDLLNTQQKRKVRKARRAARKCGGEKSADSLEDPPCIVLRWREVQARIPISRSHAHALAAQGRFPKPIKLGPRASGWIESELNQWLADRIAESRPALAESNGDSDDVH